MKKAWLLLLIILPVSLFSQTIAEKKESFYSSDNEMGSKELEQLMEVNEHLESKRSELGKLYAEVQKLYATGALANTCRSHLKQIHVLKAEIQEIQEMWREEASYLLQNEDYALWDQPNTTILQLIMDYGASEYLYLVPPEIGAIRFSVNSNLPIPRQSWGECLDIILAQQGIGVKKLNSYLKELYLIQEEPGAVHAIIDRAEQLEHYDSTTRLCYMLSPSGPDPKSALHFLQKFSNPTKTKIELIGGSIFISSSAQNIQELLKLYSFVEKGGGQQEFQLVSLNKLDATEMEKILTATFHTSDESSEKGLLRVTPLENLPHSLFLTGTKTEVKKALEVIREVESQIEDPQEKTVFWYTVKYSEAEELADVLAKVYDLLVQNPGQKITMPVVRAKEKTSNGKKGLAVSTKTHMHGSKRHTSHKTADGQNNFIVDAKSGAIIMVVEQEALPKIKELLKKLDVPKKMVQLEVLLFEKRISNENRQGLNLVKLGAQATGAASSALSWGNPKGILEFIMSRPKGNGVPAFDLAYNFMLNQEDVQINASPSITTMNQTPATIAIVNETSIDMGSDKKENHIYERAQYGITLQITPTINIDEESEEGKGFVILDTDITFDTTQPSDKTNKQPDVTRRHIENHVRIADGETLILGGLRRKSSHDTKDSIPFLGEIPGIGKLFSSTTMVDSSTEMFVFITPRIINDPIEDAEKIKREALRKRPGDIPEFLYELTHAKRLEKRRLFEGSLTALLNRAKPKVYAATRELGEYDGR